MNTNVAKNLIERGYDAFHAPGKLHEFTKNAGADKLLNDLK